MVGSGKNTDQSFCQQFSYNVTAAVKRTVKNLETEINEM